MIALLTEARVRAIAFAPRTTQIFHVLDLTLFSVLMRCPRYELLFGDDHVTGRYTRGSLRALELECEFDTRNGRYRLLSDEEQLRRSVVVRELWFVDFPWTNCRLDDGPVSSVGSTGRSKTI
jgi:hypothetical protein